MRPPRRQTVGWPQSRTWVKSCGAETSSFAVAGPSITGAVAGLADPLCYNLPQRISSCSRHARRLGTRGVEVLEALLASGGDLSHIEEVVLCSSDGPAESACPPIAVSSWRCPCKRPAQLAALRRAILKGERPRVAGVYASPLTPLDCALVGDGRAGYFNQEVIATLDTPLDFRSLSCERQYRESLAAVYAKGKAWLTPVEIFRPHYAEAIGRSMLSRHRQAYGPSEPLRICEVGGGTGTAALSLLGWLARAHPDEYARCHYRLLEPSERLARVQAARLRDAGVPPERAEARAAQAGAWSLLLLEVLDNLPHDKLRHDPDAGLLEAHALAGS
ncbi:hypothetical protein EMIHUDRAFT_217085 [Emiliania huxleyi CCMP1516]|uniref:Protein arginine methyltransferase NDUFAF7 n=2 Tax=Emiliania huxleyi TaxID=2903 RepID=A0A0D3IC34_EMIH1|nr:hypothetical protein EMIHUDRAFT_217085 [Emiliania huxleyi CCMP1516]EOD08819.1 hypothetical protein EMIHUDRAFT_217085 [Emiliania huxleyi CCMP1516]|eukprot:XP_005761248.1 hypothetical protein EMIHUDRAFT_217085 [Emiliania huxleyi CCMP1516]